MAEYEVLDKIGQGGMGAVFRVMDPSSGETLALKRLHEHLATDATVASRFLREVEIARRLDHPNIVKIREVVPHPLAFVMDYCGDRDLKSIIRERAPLPPAEIESIALQVLSALAAAHSAGIIHRDVKPQNIVLDAANHVRLLDFGLARAQGMASLTTRSMIVGTPEYMAPEILYDRHPDPRSDLYSLGVVIYEMATGVMPFKGSSPMDLISRRLESPAPDPREFLPDLPPGLASVIATSLARDPADRFQSAEDMALALAAKAPAAAAPPPRDEHCPACGAVVSSDFPACFECGDDTLLSTAPGASLVVITGLGSDPAARLRLERYLDHISGSSGILDKIGSGKKRLLVKYVGELYARHLASRISAMGHGAEDRTMGSDNSDLLLLTDQALLGLGFLGLYSLIFFLLFGFGGNGLFVYLFALLFGMVLMFGFEQWFSRRAAVVVPALIPRLLPSPAPFPEDVMQAVLDGVRHSASKKLNRDLQRIFRWSASLKNRLDMVKLKTGTSVIDPPAMVDQLMAQAMSLVARINGLDRARHGQDEAGLLEQVNELAARLDKAPAAARGDLGASLADAKAGLDAFLDQEEKREILYARLLRISSRLHLLNRTFDRAEAGDREKDFDQASMLLEKITLEVKAFDAAVREINGLAGAEA